jgi:hypothetical protein
LKGNSQVTILKMRKIFIPETSLILELTYESFWCLVKNVEEKLVFQAQDQTFYYFTNSDIIFYAKKLEGENRAAPLGSTNGFGNPFKRLKNIGSGEALFASRTAHSKPSTLKEVKINGK